MRAFINQEAFAPADKTYLGFLHWRGDAVLDAIRARMSRVIAMPPQNIVRQDCSPVADMLACFSCCPSHEQGLAVCKRSVDHRCHATQVLV